jgi:hypothetical protein
MKKVLAFAAVFAALALAFPAKCLACTSFAVYSGKTYYGMNFDHSVDDIRFFIRSDRNGGIKVFSMDFAISGKYNPTVSMNSLGLFSSCQMVYGDAGCRIESVDGAENPKEITELFSIPFQAGNVRDIRAAIAGHTVVCRYNDAHTLFADASGDATILETNNRETWLTDMKGRRIVMTNFFVHELPGSDADTAFGVGGDRYTAAAKYIDEHIGSFSYENGMAALKGSIQRDGSYPTQCSMLFDPADGAVYVALKGDFTKVWKVSIPDGTAETYSGFDGHGSVAIGRDGLSTRDLAALDGNFGEAAAQGRAAGRERPWLIWAAIAACAALAVAAGVLAALAVKRKKRTNGQ